MRILVCGDRNFSDWQRVSKFMDSLGPDDVVIEGEAPGADILARDAAKRRRLTVDPYFAHWKHTKECPSNCNRMTGKPAGPIRNTQMLDEGKPDRVVAFHDDIEQSKGTKNMLKQALKRNIPCHICTWIEDGREIYLMPYRRGL